MAIRITIGPLKQFHVPIGGDEETEEQGSEPPPVLRAELQIPPTIVDRYEAHQQQNDRRENLRTIVESLTLLAILGTLIVTGISTCAAVHSAEIAGAALEATKESSRLDQRAWVGAVVSNAPEIVAGAEVSFQAVIGNTGKTPALYMWGGISARTLNKGQEFFPTYKTDSAVRQINSVSTLFPEMRSVYETPPTKLTQAQVKALQDEDTVLYVYGRIGYQDIFLRPHCTTFCVTFAKDLKVPKGCLTYNDVTNTECNKDENG
jgi:hypothetical protein